MGIASFYSVISSDTRNQPWKFGIKIKSDHEIFRGHFPGFGIVPGAMLIQIVKDILEASQEKKLHVTEVITAKFLRMLKQEELSEIELILSMGDGQEFNVDAEFRMNNLSCCRLKMRMA